MRLRTRVFRGKAAPLAVLATLSLVVAAACGGGSGGGGGGSDTAEIGFYTDKAAWEPQFKQVSDASKKDIGTSLKFTGYSDANQYAAFIKQSFRTNKKPDLFTWHTGSELQDLVKENLVADTSSIWTQAIKDGNVPEALKPYFTIEGKQYCVPLNAAYWVMYYNKKVFTENDITPPKTWNDLIASADKLKAAGVTPFYQTNVLFSFVWFQTLLAGTDPDLYNDLSTGKAKYTDPKVVAVMNQWGDMIKKGYFIDAGTKTSPDALLKNGQVAMVNFGTFLAGQLNALKMKSGTDYDFFVIPNVNPSLSKTVLPFETGPMCTAANATNLDKALDYGKWWMTPEAQTAWSNARGDVSFNTKAKVNDKALATLNNDAKGYQLVNRYFEATPTPILTAALDGFGKFTSNGGDPKPILENIQKAADDYWSKNK